MSASSGLRSAAGGSSNDLSLTQPISRSGRSPRTPASATTASSQTHPSVQTQYVSFPTPAQVALDRRSMAAASSASSSSSLPPAPMHTRSDSVELFDDAAAKQSKLPQSRRSLWYTFVAFVISTPALLGMCCWPSIIAAAIGGSATGGARVLSHSISLIVTGVVLAAMLSYFAYNTRARAQLHSSHSSIYGPLYLLAFASVLVMADPVRHVLQDNGVWSGPSSNAFREGCGEGWRCLTLTGALFMGLFTYVGFALMFYASAWNGNLVAKCRMCAREWHSIRAAHAAQELADSIQSREEAERAREEAARARHAAIAASVATKPPSFSFGSHHVSMAPPAFLYAEQESNKHARLGQLTTSMAATPGPLDSPLGSATNRGAQRGGEVQYPSSSSAAATAAQQQQQQQQAKNSPSQSGGPSSTRSDYSASGYSLEVRSPATVDTKIGSKDAPQLQERVVGALSPTLSNSPSVSSAGGIPSFASPMSTSINNFDDVALTPASSNGKAFTPNRRTPGQLDSPASLTGISPRTGELVKAQFKELQQAASPFNKAKYKEQQAAAEAGKAGPV